MQNMQIYIFFLNLQLLHAKQFYTTNIYIVRQVKKKSQICLAYKSKYCYPTFLILKKIKGD
jgi:hypothetical protein